MGWIALLACVGEKSERFSLRNKVMDSSAPMWPLVMPTCTTKAFSPTFVSTGPAAVDVLKARKKHTSILVKAAKSKGKLRGKQVPAAMKKLDHHHNHLMKEMQWMAKVC